jgi:hydrogenase nickel incorporation protein HypA/HybF
MHELSLAVNAVEICLNESKGQRISKVVIEKGVFSGVDSHAFEFAWPEATKGTDLSESVMELLEKAGVLRCKFCQHSFASKELITLCPKCENFNFEIIEGREFRVLSLEVENVS